jgi:cobalt-zinc-cadmium efflux system membrane fusion protein
MSMRRNWLYRSIGGLALVVLALVAVGMATGVLHLPSSDSGAEKPDPPEDSLLAVELVHGKAHTVSVPADVRRALGIRKKGKDGKEVDQIAAAEAPVRTRPLVMPGSTAIDPGLIVRLHIRFAPADVVQVGSIDDPHSPVGSTQPPDKRPLQAGDSVKSGQRLLRLRSVDVGNKKNDLFDALSQLRLDQEILANAQKKSSAVPEVFLNTAKRNAEADVINIQRAENTLYSWEIPEADIQAVRDAAAKIATLQDKAKMARQKIEEWGRVDLTSPIDGVLLEQNVSQGTITDNTQNLFQIAPVDPLVVYANVPEDNLPDLEDLKSSTKNWIDWTVKTVGAKPIQGYVDSIGYLIDPNQHTAMVRGHIPNHNGALRGGQFVTASVELRPPKDVVEVPIGAVVEDGTQSIVFVQEDPTKPVYAMRRVKVTHRFDGTAYIRSTPIPKEEQLTPEEEAEHLLPKEPLHLGERVLTAGALELKGRLLELESQAGN